jgi:hypothetical protein
MKLEVEGSRGLFVGHSLDALERKVGLNEIL